MTNRTVALTAKPQHLLPEDVRRDPFKDLRETYVARNQHADHPDGYLTGNELEDKLHELKSLRDHRIQNLKRVAHFMRQMLGISTGLDWKDLDVAWGVVSGDGKRATLFNLGNPSLDRALKAFGPALRATDVFNAPGDTRLELAVINLPFTRWRDDGTVEETLRPLCLPLDFPDAVAEGWLDVDLDDGDIFHMPATRDSADRMWRLSHPNVAFCRNVRMGGDRSRTFVGFHPESGKLVFSAFVPPDFVNEPRTKTADQKRIGVEVVERLTSYEVTRVEGSVSFPQAISDEEWAKRQAAVARNFWKVDLALERRPAFKSYHVRLEGFVFDGRVILGLPTEGELTAALLEASSTRKKLSKGGETHVRNVVTGQLVLEGFSCRAPVEKGKEWLTANAANLFAAAIKRLEGMLATSAKAEDVAVPAADTPPAELPIGEPARGQRSTPADPPLAEIPAAPATESSPETPAADGSTPAS